MCDNDDVTDDDHPQDAVPVAFCQTRPMRLTEDLRPHSYDELKGRRVRMYVSGFWTEGLFVGADEDSVYLRGELKWRIYPLDAIGEVRVLDDDDGQSVK